MKIFTVLLNETKRFAKTSTLMILFLIFFLLVKNFPASTIILASLILFGRIIRQELPKVDSEDTKVSTVNRVAVILLSLVTSVLMLYLIVSSTFQTSLGLVIIFLNLIISVISFYCFRKLTFEKLPKIITVQTYIYAIKFTMVLVGLLTLQLELLPITESLQIEELTIEHKVVGPHNMLNVI